MNAPIPASVLHPELAAFAAQIEKIREDAAQLVDGLSDKQMNWRTHPGRWSIAQCLAHITLGNEQYLGAMDTTIMRARSRQLFGAGPFKHGWFGNWFARSFEPPPKFKTRNPKIITPPPDIPGEAVVVSFQKSQEDILRRLCEANGIDLGRAKMTSPFFRLLRLSLGQAFAVLTAHARRHLWQAWQVRKDAAFPKN
jgi:hypothetical protein